MTNAIPDGSGIPVDRDVMSTGAGQRTNHIKYYPNIEQGTDEWFAVRCGLLTASEMKNLVNEKIERVKPKKKDKDITYLYELLAQRITGYVAPSWQGDNMIRGHEDEIYAIQAYSENYAPVQQMGFITNDKWGFTLGYSPDGLVGDDGIIEGKSRCYKYQLETILEEGMPAEYNVQVQTGLLVSERKWCDFISYPERGGWDMATIRVPAHTETQEFILDTAADFEKRLQEKLRQYQDIVASGRMHLIKTERRTIEEEITI